MGHSKKNIYKQSDKECRKCGLLLQEVSHKEVTDKILRQEFYYLRWYKCPSCHWQLNLEEDKVWNNSEVIASLKQEEEQLSFMSSLEKPS